jgi:hypothetical protein
MRWMLKEDSNKKRESKRRNISKKCLLKTKNTRLRLWLNVRKRDSRTFAPRKNMLVCWTNKNTTESMKLRPENSVLKNL